MAEPWVWQLPIFALATTVWVALVAAGASGLGPSGTALGWLLIAGAGLASLSPAARTPGWRWRLLLPVTDLVGAVAINCDVQGALPSVKLLAALPMFWLGFEFGRRGIALAGAGVIGVALLPYVVGPGLERGPLAVIDVVLTIGIGVGTTAVATVLARVLTRAQDRLLADSRRVAAELDKLNAVMEVVDAAVVILVDGEEPRLNEQATLIGELVGVDVDNLADAAHVYEQDGVTPVPAERRAIARAQAGESFRGMLHYAGPPGDQRAVLSSCHQLSDEDGRRTGCVIVGIDATTLVEAVRVREDFLTTVSHELRTPLTSISAALEMLHGEIDDRRAVGDQGRDDVVAERLLEIARRNAATLLTRINQLLSAAPGAVEELRPQPHDLGRLLRDALVKHREASAQRGIVLEASAADGVVVETDRVAVERVVDNLVSNAIKYSKAGGRVRVMLRQVGDRVELAVADAGIGMTRDEQRQVFDRFYRSTRVVDAAVPGIGIGLTVTKRLVHLLGGRIEVDSEPQVGTTMTVVLPAPVSAGRGLEARSPALPRTSTSGRSAG